MKNFSHKYYWLLVILLFLGNIFIRFWHLGYPNWQIFDEVYYPQYAHDYLTGQTFFDVHPPLGKLLMSASIYLLGNGYLGWRFSEAVFGAGVILLIFFFTLKLFKNRATALVSLILASCSTMLFVESRLGLINIFLVFFILLGLVLFWDWLEKKNDLYLIFSFMSLSLATCVKWTGALAVLACVTYILILVGKDKQYVYLIKKKWLPLLLALIIFCLVYTAIFYLRNNSGYGFTQWHKQATSFHLNLTATHPYQSRWWTWPLGTRPIWLEFKETSKNTYTALIEIANIPLFWLGIISFFYSLVKIAREKNKALIFLTSTILILFLPWALVKRVTFLYLFLPIVPLLVIINANLLIELFKSKVWRIPAIVVILLIMSFFIYFYPLLIGTPISYSTYQQHMWLKSWY